MLPQNVLTFSYNNFCCSCCCRYKALDQQVKLAISHALAQSSKLSVYEKRVADLVEEVSAFTWAYVCVFVCVCVCVCERERERERERCICRFSREGHYMHRSMQCIGVTLITVHQMSK
jgi:hypothetical protein